MQLTYRELIEQLKELDSARLDDTVTVFVQGTGEYYPLDNIHPTGMADEDCDILDVGHFYLRI